MKKKIIVLFMVISMCLGSITGCGNDTELPTNTPEKSSEANPTSADNTKSTPTTAAQSSTPAPTAVTEGTPAPTKTTTNEPKPTVETTATPAPTATKAATATPAPTATKAATATPAPTATKAATATPAPTATKAATATPAPTATKAATATPAPTATKAATATPAPTATKAATATPTVAATATPAPTATKAATAIPTATNTPAPTATKTPTPMPTKTAAQRVSFDNSSVDKTYEEYEVDGIPSAEELFLSMVGGLYNYDSNISVNFTLYSENEETMIDAAKKLAAIGGIENVEIVESFKYYNGYAFSVTINSTATFRYFYAINTKDESFLEDYDAEVLQVLYQLVNEAKKYKTDFEKETYFHDYLVSTISYKHTESDQTVYGALIEKKCVCNGYAGTFELLMNMAGIPCTFVVGSGNNDDHAWNQVLLEGAWYNVDVTWDDPDSGDSIRYLYLNVRDQEFYTEHIPDNSDIPICFATEYEARNIKYNSCNTQEEVNAVVSESAEKNKNSKSFTVVVLYTGKDKLDVNSICNVIGKGASYSYMESSMGVLYSLVFE